MFAGEEDEDVEVKQTYVSQYESMHITAILQPYKFPEVHTDSGEYSWHWFWWVTLTLILVNTLDTDSGEYSWHW